MSQDPYEVLAQVYDQDIHLEIPRAFFRTVRPLIEGSCQGFPVLDLGCGSGLLTERIAKTGARVVGIDGSRSMLTRARRRCARYPGRVSLCHGKLDGFRLTETFRLAVACGDVVNHLPSLPAVRRFFRMVQRALDPGGFFVFDAITKYCFETYWPDNTHLLEGPLGDVVMSCNWEPTRKRGTARIISYVRRAPDTFSRREAILHEYFYANDQVIGALVGAGFEQVWERPWCPYGSQDGDSLRHRRLWCARAPDPKRTFPVKPLRPLGFRPLV